MIDDGDGDEYQTNHLDSRECEKGVRKGERKS